MRTARHASRRGCPGPPGFRDYFSSPAPAQDIRLLPHRDHRGNHHACLSPPHPLPTLSPPHHVTSPSPLTPLTPPHLAPLPPVHVELLRWWAIHFLAHNATRSLQETAFCSQRPSRCRTATGLRILWTLPQSLSSYIPPPPLLCYFFSKGGHPCNALIIVYAILHHSTTICQIMHARGWC